MKPLLRCLMLGGIALILSASCVRRPEKVMSDKQMAPVVADYELARAMNRMGSGGVRLSDEELLMSVLDKNHVDRATYDSTINWYARNPDKYYVLCSLVEKQLAQKRKKYAGKGVEQTTSDLWPYGRMAVFSDMADNDGMTFSVATSEVEPGQRLQLRMRFSSRAEGDLIFGVEYDNGEKAFTNSKITQRKIDVTLQTDTARTVNRIFGNLVLGSDTRRPVWADSISLTALPFDSLEYHRVNVLRRYSKPSRRVKQKKEESTDTVEPVNVEPEKMVVPEFKLDKKPGFSKAPR